MNLSPLGKRKITMRHALNLLAPGANIVETGCVRVDDNWAGDGMSTVVFGEWVTQHGGHLWTVDIDPANLATAQRLTSEYRDIDFHLGDSVAFLAALDEPIDLLYLDSLDYPYGELLDLYGGKQDIHLAAETLRVMGEARIVALHGDLIGPSQEHCQAEVLAAQPSLSLGAMVLIDDAGLAGGGKARLAKELLAAEGFHCLRDDYQTLWAR